MSHRATTATPLRVLCITDVPATLARVRDALGTYLPGTECLTHPGDNFAVEAIPAADCAVVGEASGMTALEVLQRLRASGFDAPAVVVADAPDPGLRARAGQVGAGGLVGRDEIGSALAPAIASAMHARGERDGDAIGDELRHTRRLIAAGEVALRLQHDLNNPLAGLLAESQLLEMEDLPPEQLDAVRRIVQLCRRLIVLVRRLDGMSESGGPR